MKLVTTDQANHDVLRKPAQAISFPLNKEVKQFIADMKQFIHDLESPYGKPAGLAAPQVGKPWQIILFQIPEEAKKVRQEVLDVVPLTVWLNPSYEPIEEDGKYLGWEGCYSVENKMGEVHRYNAIRYTAFDEAGKKLTDTAHGFLARLLQHEIGHLNAELYIDLLDGEGRFGAMDEMLQIRKKELN